MDSTEPSRAAMLSKDVAELLFDWKPLTWRQGRYEHPTDPACVWSPTGWYTADGDYMPYHYATDNAQAEKVIDRLLELGYHVDVMMTADPAIRHRYHFVKVTHPYLKSVDAGGEHRADTICRAARGAILLSRELPKKEES